MAKKSETTTENKSVVKKDEAALPISVEELEAMSGQGFEGADKDSYAIPFLRILQSTSPQINEDEPAYIEGAKVGMFFNTITGELFGKELDVIPAHYARDFIEWMPNRGGFVTTHGSDPVILDRIVKIDDNNNSILDNDNVIQDTRNHYVLLADHLEQGPIILSLTSTGIKHSKKWMTLMNTLMIPNSKKQAPMFAGVWKIESVQNKNDDGTWYQVGDKSATCIKFKNWVDKDQLEAATSFRKLLAAGEAKADWDSADGESNKSGVTQTGSPSAGGYEKDGKQFDSEGNEIPF